VGVKTLGADGEIETCCKSNHLGMESTSLTIFLHGMHAYYPNANFILVLRNGLDMAYSKQDQQLRYWSTYFQMDSKDLSP
jgi:hypothetical protein